MSDNSDENRIKILPIIHDEPRLTFYTRLFKNKNTELKIMKNNKDLIFSGTGSGKTFIDSSLLIYAKNIVEGKCEVGFCKSRQAKRKKAQKTHWQESQTYEFR
ncbi:MAG: hypothetical protein ACQEXV_22430 [Bacillota bacterium]